MEDTSTPYPTYGDASDTPYNGATDGSMNIKKVFYICSLLGQCNSREMRFLLCWGEEELDKLTSLEEQNVASAIRAHQRAAQCYIPYY